MALEWIRDFIRRNIVDTVPDQLDHCLSCGKPECPAAAYGVCAARIARAVTLGQERAAAEAAAQQAPLVADRAYPVSAACASRTTASNAPGAKGEMRPAERTNSVNGATPPRPQSAT
jgi:hypothetical protein